MLDGLKQQLIEVSALSEDDAVSVLHAFDWNVENAIQGLLDNPEASAPKLWCGHTACTQCWKTSKAQCLGTDCNASVGHSEIVKLMDVSLLSRYTHLLHEAMVMASRSMVWCPTPDCKTVVKAESAVATLGSVECKTCKNQFCFECGVEHAPALCSHMRSFEKKCAKEGGNIDWLVKNTRECPKCAAFIEKHSEVDAAGGDHKCNVFKEGEEKEVSARKEDQEKMKMADERRRFAHYHSRYQAHENSAKLEKKLLLRHRGQNMPVHSKGELCTQLLETQGEALTLLGNARRTLWASYVLGYYQVWEKGTSLKEVFEDLQHLLENRTAIMSNMAAVRTNQRNLIVSTTSSSTAYTSP
eukprot:gene13681-6887_t